MNKQERIKKEKITLNAYDHGIITKDLQLTYKGKPVHMVEEITLKAVTDSRVDKSEGLKELLEDIKKYEIKG